MIKKIFIAFALVLLLLAGGLYWHGHKQAPEPLPAEPVVQKTSEEAERVRATLFFAGDMMFDRYVRQKAEERGYGSVLEGFEDMVRKADLAIANLEGPITSNASVSLGTNVSAGGDHFTFTFDTQVAEALGELGFDLLSLANNHSMNFGESGIRETRMSLAGSGIGFFGDPLDENMISYSTTTKGIRISFVGYNQFGYPGEAEALAEVERLSSTDKFVVVFPHWGEEYEKTPTPAVRSLARAFVDAGADMVIGAHSHIIGDKEAYKGALIYYSLGNFVFDQYFGSDVRCGLVLEVALEEKDGQIIVADIFESNSWLSEDGRTLNQECL